MLPPSADQAEFDTLYMTSSEICSRLGVKRSSIVVARQRGALPAPIVVQGCKIHIWKRPEVLPYVERWERLLRERRGELTA